MATKRRRHVAALKVAFILYACMHPCPVHEMPRIHCGARRTCGEPPQYATRIPYPHKKKREALGELAPNMAMF